jgi:hypothetical protein
MKISTAYRAVRNNRVTGKAAEGVPEPGHPTIVPACPRKWCFMTRGHHSGIHGEYANDPSPYMGRQARRAMMRGQ